jgi:hypothetical protein
LENPADGAPPLVAAPRHLRRRRLHEDIPDTLLVPDAAPHPLSAVRASREPTTQQQESERSAPAKRAANLDLDDAEVAYRRKRMAALLAVVFVAVSVPALVIALLLLG